MLLLLLLFLLLLLLLSFIFVCVLFLVVVLLVMTKFIKLRNKLNNVYKQQVHYSAFSSLRILVILVINWWLTNPYKDYRGTSILTGKHPGTVICNVNKPRINYKCAICWSKTEIKLDLTKASIAKLMPTNKCSLLDKAVPFKSSSSPGNVSLKQIAVSLRRR